MPDTPEERERMHDLHRESASMPPWERMALAFRSLPEIERAPDLSQAPSVDRLELSGLLAPKSPERGEEKEKDRSLTLETRELPATSAPLGLVDGIRALYDENVRVARERDRARRWLRISMALNVVAAAVTVVVAFTAAM